MREIPDAKKIPRDKLKKFIGELGKGSRVIAPVKTRDKVLFKELSPNDEIYLGSNPVNSASEFFLPYSEILFEFKQSGDRFELNPGRDTGERVLFGIRPCDVHALGILDMVAGGKFEDPYYRKKREKTTLVALSCVEPMEGCFCTSFGTGPSLNAGDGGTKSDACGSAGGGADLLLTDIGDYYLAEPFTTRGEKIIQLKLFENASGGDKKIRDARIKKAREMIQKQGIEQDLGKMHVEEIPKKLEELFDDKSWGELSERCVSCAICTYMCPTCHCFDVVDEPDSSKAQGKRIRCKDSCMFPSFTLQAGGENPRQAKKERLRQRIYHKFKYFPERHGKFACVGCGRCVRLCPVGIDIVEIISQVKSQVKHKTG